MPRTRAIDGGRGIDDVLLSRGSLASVEVDTDTERVARGADRPRFPQQIAAGAEVGFDQVVRRTHVFAEAELAEAAEQFVRQNGAGDRRVRKRPVTLLVLAELPDEDRAVKLHAHAGH